MGTVQGEPDAGPPYAFRDPSIAGNNKNGYCLAGKTTSFNGNPFPVGGQFVAKTYFEAKATCASYGLKLCDVRPTSNGINGLGPHCRGYKCNYDSRYVWTDISCAEYSELDCPPTAAPSPP